MSNRLTWAWAKLERAQEHADAFTAEILRVAVPKAYPFDLAIKFEPQSSSYLIKVARMVDLTHTGLILGDALQNFRSALDYAVWQVVSEVGTCPPDDRTQFPFAKTEAGWKATVGDRLRCVPTTQLAIIEHAQPKARGNAIDSYSLTILGDLSNQDKHRVMIPSLMYASEIEFGVPVVANAEFVRTDWLITTPVRSKSAQRSCVCSFGTQNRRRIWMWRPASHRIQRL